MGRSLDEVVAAACADVAAGTDWDSFPAPEMFAPSAVAVAMREDVATASVLNEEWAERSTFTPERLERFRSRLSAFAVFAMWRALARRCWSADAPEVCRERVLRVAFAVTSDGRFA